MSPITLLAAALLFFAPACSEAPTPSRTPEREPPQPVEGQRAFYQMYGAARVWSPDVQGLTLESVRLPEVPSQGGRFGAWRATFVSPGKRQAIVFHYSVIDSSARFVKGVFQDSLESYSAGGLEKPWPVSVFHTSSDQALEVALQQETAQKYVKENPDKEVNFLLSFTNRHPAVTWRVIWGSSVSTSDFSVFIDAASGLCLETMR